MKSFQTKTGSAFNDWYLFNERRYRNTLRHQEEQENPSHRVKAWVSSLQYNDKQAAIFEVNQIKELCSGSPG